MADSKPDPNKRSYLLPAGCKNFGDVPVKRKPANAKFTPLKVRVNGQITASLVDVRDESGTSLGVHTLSAALAIAQSRALDLVQIKPDVTPPFCLLIDYGAFRFQTRRGKLPKKWTS